MGLAYLFSEYTLNPFFMIWVVYSFFPALDAILPFNDWNYSGNKLENIQKD
jgi:hypothetical protein